MATSKISEVNEVKEWGEGERKTFYHNLVMDNGDKINIGKKKQQQVGWELTYEITGDPNQQEYTKAKSVNPDYVGGQENTNHPTPQKDDYQIGIETGHALNCAVQLVKGKAYASKEECMQEIEDWANRILSLSNKMKSNYGGNAPLPTEAQHRNAPYPSEEPQH